MRILLATDGSHFSEEAGRLISRLPHSEKLQLTVLSVCPTHEIHGSLEAMAWIDRQQDADRKSAADACQRIARMFDGADAVVEEVVRDGHPGQEIVKEAKERQVDLIVIGAEGHSTLGRVLMGSVSDFVATHAECSVLVVRQPASESAEHKALRICIAHDGSEPAEFATKQLAEFQWRQNAKIQVVSVLSFPITYMNEPIEFDIQPTRDALERSAEAVADSLRELSPEVSSGVVEAQHVGDGIVRFAKRNEGDLIVLGSTGRGLLGRFLLGSVAQFVLRHAKCSVWIARDAKAKS